MIKEDHKRINRRLRYAFIVTLIAIQAAGLRLLLQNLNVYSAIISAIVLGFLAPILIGAIFVMLAKTWRNGLNKLR